MPQNRMKNQLDTVFENEDCSDATICKDKAAFSESACVTEKSAFLKHRETIDIKKAEQDIEDAKEEWEMVSSTAVMEGEQVDLQPIAYEEVLIYYQTKNMKYFLQYIKPVKERTKIEALLNWLVGPPKLHSSLIQDRDLIFAIAQCPFDTSDTVHMRVLQTVYKSLTGCEKDCPRYGNHWEKIGFQGVDPGTDLRGVGFLGLIHLLHFLLDPGTAKLSKEIAAIAESKTQEFPFCVMGINITRIVLETMRDEVLNKHCNKQKSVFSLTNDFYASVYLQFFNVWKDQKKTIMDSGFVLEDLSVIARKKPSFLLCQLADYKSKTGCLAQNMFSDVAGTTSLKAPQQML